MKCKIPEISWHNRDPVLSVDIQPKSNATNGYYRLASGGTDAHVLIWYMKLTSSGEYGDIELDLAADLARHQKAVNVVKWSPSGDLLASGDDESVVFIWKQKSDTEPLNILDSTNDQDKEVWITLKVLRGHMEDVYDLSWAPNSLYLVSGAVDNSAIIWDVHKGKSLAILNDHKGFVQGVAWDPKNQYIASLSTDRYMRIFDINTKKVLYRVSKGTLPVPADNSLHGKRMRLFHDDTLQTFFRRLTFTPDGKFLLTPSGVTDYDGCIKPLNTTYIFSRYGFRQPAIVLPCPDQYTVAVKCCPLLYKLRPFNAEKNPPVVPLPYRMIFAVATKSSIYFYDTQQKQPFALISNIHYTRLTDITWSNDGRVVVVSSTDGFCSLITFEKGELGEEYEHSESVLETALAQVTKKTKKQKDNENAAKAIKPTDELGSMRKDAVNVLKASQLENVNEEEGKLKEDNKNARISGSIEAKGGDVETSAIQQLTTAEQKVLTTVEIKHKRVDQEKKADNLLEDKTTNDVKDEDSESSSGVIKQKSEITNDVTTKSEQTVTVPIGIDGNNDICSKSDDTTSPNKTSTFPCKVLSAEIIIDKEILSSEEKFESPEKKSRPATPITVRRHPRTPSSLPQTPTSMSNILKSQVDHYNQSPLSSLPKGNVTPLQDKRPKPIAIRKTPRSIISAPVINTTSMVEEAMDAWPLDSEESHAEKAKLIVPNVTTEAINETGVTPLPLSEATSERTEDIRLVYEETIEEAPSKESLSKMDSTETKSEMEKAPLDSPKPQTPGNKTPRRVPLRTISTPKSKKRLLE